MDAIREYFDKQGSEYEHNIKRSFIWNLIKEREKEVLFKLLSPRSGEVILDAGSGPGIYAEALKKTGCDVVCVDISFCMIQAARQKGMEGHEVDIEHFVLSRRFDKIICAGVFEFISFPSLALINLKRHLKNNGAIVLLVPKRSCMGYAYKAIHRLHSLRIHLFSMNQLKALFEECRMRVVEVSGMYGLSWVLKIIPY